MRYVEWNNIISQYFFNPNNAGKDVYLFLTKNDIISLARRYFEHSSDEEIWHDFVTKIKFGLSGGNENVITKAKNAFEKRNLQRIVINEINYEINYPPYITYLVFLVLPLIEFTQDRGQRTNSYYSRLNSFLEINQINQKIGTVDFSNNKINLLWEHLEHWANVKHNGDLGFFNVVPFTNASWVYVGKVFSQCVLPPKILNSLPKLFESIGLVPNTLYEDNFLRDKIKNSRTDVIPKSTLDHLKKGDELSNSIIQTIQKQYKKWNGETHEEIEDGEILRKKRKYTVAPLFLQFRVNTNSEEINFSYRMYSANDYPEDLKFGEQENLYEINGWSKTLHVGFKERLELKDNFNKWIAKLPDRDVRLFISAGALQLSNDFWIETDVLSKTGRMYLLCKNEKLETIEEWGETFPRGKFKKEDFDGLPESYSLFWFCDPERGVSDISILTLYTEKRIELVGGLKVNFRTYINDSLPEVEIINSNGNETVYLQYKGTVEKIFLSKKTSFNTRWLLPKNTRINTDFYIKIENENFAGNELAYSLSSPAYTALKVDDSKLPKRDSFGRNITTDTEQYCLGSNIINPRASSKRYFSTYGSLFTSTNQETATSISTAKFICNSGNNLCNFLSLKGTLTTEEFFRVFEYHFSKEFSITENTNFTKLKRASLNYYDFIGILDYDYENKSISIVMSPAQFVFIPTAKGRKVLLIGARDSALIEKIINISPKYHLQVEITKQFLSNQNLLLPDVISVKSFQQEDDSYGERGLKALAEELNIKFTSDYFPQIALQDYSATIVDYENTMQEVKDDDYEWARYIFIPETLIFVKSETSTFDKSFTLVKYKLNEYNYEFKLWKNNKCYKVDMNWGRFIVLKHFKKNVILFDSLSNKVAIPIETPLPRLLSESIMLLSGLAPDFKVIDGKKYRVYENVTGIFSQNLFRLKLGQSPINKAL